MPDTALEIAPRRAEPEIGEQLLEQQLHRTPIDVTIRANLRIDAAQRIQVQGKELDRRVNPDRVEQPPGDRTEEGLQEFRVSEAADLLRVARSDGRPQRGVERARSEPLPQAGRDLADHAPVEVEGLSHTPLYPGPVATFEGLGGRALDGRIRGVVARECRNYFGGDIGRTRRMVR